MEWWYWKSRYEIYLKRRKYSEMHLHLHGVEYVSSHEIFKFTNDEAKMCIFRQEVK